jgi:hypothetical protein
MVNRELVKQAVDQLPEAQLQEVAEFIALIKFRELQFQELALQSSWQPLIDSLSLFSDDFMTTRAQPEPELCESLD